MGELHNSWLTRAIEQLSPHEQVLLGQPPVSGNVVDHMIAIARRSRRAEARRAALGGLLPAARDRLPGVLEVGVHSLNDASKLVRWEACAILAVSLEPSVLPALEKSQAKGVVVPRDGLQAAIRAIKSNKRSLFRDAAESGKVIWILQDEVSELNGVRVVGSKSFGTHVRAAEAPSVIAP